MTPRNSMPWEGHRLRLRSRMEREGWDALKPHEMVELVLCQAMPRQDLSELSRRLVERFGSVGGVFSAPRDALMDIPGMNDHLAEWVEITGELVRAYRALQGEPGVRLRCFSDMRAFIERMEPLRDGAWLWAVFADFDFNMLCYCDLREDPTWWEAENLKRMVAEGIDAGARYAYIVRWLDAPPLGPDEQDPERLEGIAFTFSAADIDLVDCLLVGGGRVFSMNLNGCMDAAREVWSSLALRESYDE